MGSLAAAAYPALSSLGRYLQVEGALQVAHDEACPATVRALPQHAGHRFHRHVQWRVIAQRAQHVQWVQQCVCVN